MTGLIVIVGKVEKIRANSKVNTNSRANWLDLEKSLECELLRKDAVGTAFNKMGVDRSGF